MYHLKCYAQFLKNTQRIPQDNQEDKAEAKCFKEVMILLQQRHSKGQIYSLKAVWTFYSNRQGQKHQLESGVYRSNKCKDRIQGFIGDSATFVEPMNPSEPHLIVSSNLGEEALQYLLTESNWQLHTEDESCHDELRTDAIEDIDLDANC